MPSPVGLSTYSYSTGEVSQRVDAGLGLGEGVGAPLADATGVEIVVAAPAAADVGGVVGPPRAGAEPGVPVHLVLGRLGFGGQPVVPHLGGVPRRDVGVGGVHLARAGRCGPSRWRRRSSPRSAAACRSGRRGRSAGPSPPPPGPSAMVMRGGLLGIDVLARPHGQDGGQRVPAVAGGDQHARRCPCARPGTRACRGTSCSPCCRTCVSTICLTASRWDFLASQMATNCTSFSGSIQFKHARAAAADADAAQHDPLAGRHGAVAAQRGSRDDDTARQWRRWRPPLASEIPAASAARSGKIGGDNFD